MINVYYVQPNNDAEKFNNLLNTHNDDKYKFIPVSGNGTISLKTQDLAICFLKNMEKKTVEIFGTSSNVIFKLDLYSYIIDDAIEYQNFEYKETIFFSNFCASALIYNMFNMKFNSPLCWGVVTDKEYGYLLSGSELPSKIELKREPHPNGIQNMPSLYGENFKYILNHYINYDDEKICNLYYERLKRMSEQANKFFFSIAYTQSQVELFKSYNLKNHIILTPLEAKGKNVISVPNWKELCINTVYDSGIHHFYFYNFTRFFNLLKFYQDAISGKDCDIYDYVRDDINITYENRDEINGNNRDITLIKLANGYRVGSKILKLEHGKLVEEIDIKYYPVSNYPRQISKKCLVNNEWISKKFEH